jgi:hypothetical protein
MPGAGALRMFEIIFLASKKIECSTDPLSSCRGIPSNQLSKRKVAYMAASSLIRFFPEILAKLPEMFAEFQDVQVSELLCDADGMIVIVLLM